MADSHRPAVAVTITLNPVYRGADGGLTPLPEEGRTVLVCDGRVWFSATRCYNCWNPLGQPGRVIQSGDVWSFLPLEGAGS